MRRDEFIGQRFGEDGQFEVLGWHGEIYKPPNSTGGDKLYTAKCHVCSKDPELFGEALYKVVKSVIRGGKLPCGCGERARKTPEQYQVLVQRECAARNYSLVQIDWTSNKTLSSCYIHYQCNVCSTHNRTTSVTNFLRGTGCKRCAEIATGDANSKPDDVMIAGFLATGKYKEGTKFSRTGKRTNNGAAKLWDVECPVCSKDEYVQNGLCSGVFTGHSGTLAKGMLSCRCASNHIWTKAQREYNLAKLLVNEPNYKFVGWVGEYKSCRTQMVMNCVDHGDWTVKLNNFISDNSTRCPACSGSGGFDKNERAVVYVLRIRGESAGFTGYGISNHPEKRLADHRRSLTPYGFTIVERVLIDMAGHEAAEIESRIKQKFPHSKQEPEGFRREATYSEHYQDVIDFVERTLDEITNN